jgi:hypothetical protein
MINRLIGIYILTIIVSAVYFNYTAIIGSTSFITAFFILLAVLSPIILYCIWGLISVLFQLIVYGKIK